MRGQELATLWTIDNQWTICNMTAIAADYFTFSCAGVGGEWRRIASIDITFITNKLLTKSV